MNSIYKIILLFFISSLGFAQGGAPNCAALEANPQMYQSCATSIPFSNSTTPNTETYSISCFEQAPKAPAWFYIKIKNSGDIFLEISQVSNLGNAIDVDFVLWGPFNSLSNICSQLNQGSEKDCSWSISSVENVQITNAIADEYYILLVDNYSQLHGEITITQTGGTGSSDCSFLSDVKIKDTASNEITQLNYCKPATKSLMATVNTTNFPGTPSNLRFSYKWFKDGVLIATTNSSLSSTNTISVSETGTYKVQIAAYDSTDSSIDPTNLPFTDDQSDSIDLNFFTAPNINIQATSQCLNANPVLQTNILNTEIQTYTYQWFVNNTTVSAATAQNYSPTLSGDYSVKVANAGCAAVTSNSISVYQKPQVSIANDKIICDGDSFQITSLLQNSIGLTNVSYQWFKDGVLISGATSSNYTVSASNQSVGSTAIYTLQVTEQGLCSTTSNAVSIKINALPLLSSAPIIVEQCDFTNPNNDGISITNLTQAYNDITNNTPGLTLSYFLDAGLTQPISNPTAFQNSVPFNQTIYVTAIDATQNPICTSLTASLLIKIAASSIANYPNITAVCPEVNTTYGLVDLAAQSNFIHNNYFASTNVTILFYSNPIDAATKQNPLTNTTQFPIGTSTIYTRIESNNNCFGIGTFQIEVSASPIQTVISPIIACKDELILLSSKDNEALLGQNPTVQASYFNSFDNAKNNVLAINKNTTMPLTTGTTPLFVRLYDSNTNCFSIVNFNCTVFPNPTIVAPSPISHCGSATALFNLDSRINQIIGSNAGFQVFFYETLADFSSGNNITNTTTYSAATKTLLVKVVDPNNNNCSSKTTLTLKVLTSPGSSTNPTALQNCNSSGFSVFDLTQREVEMAGATPLNQIAFKYYRNVVDAQANNNTNITTPTAFSNTNAWFQKLYVRLNSTINSDSETGEACYEILELDLYVRPFPVNYLKSAPYTICVDSNLNVINKALIDTELSATNYHFVWYNGFNALAGNEISGATSSTYTTGVEGNYSVQITDFTNPAMCSTTANFTTKNTLIPLTIVGNPSELIAFEVDNTITAIATPASSDFEYMLNDNGWQESNIFENVTGGLYELKVRNKFGCGTISTYVVLVDYPRFFTPNGDGVNDFWNIQGLSGLTISNTYIFDRFGKLITEIKVNTNGWDGNLNGKPVPADDYWFKIVYSKNGKQQEFLSHFSLKR
jgi:gliding motility-associated-like protein